MWRMPLQSRRSRNPMPDFVLQALDKRRLMDAFRSRPPYQRNDYLGWITRAKLEATRRRRLDRMLDELERWNLYMNMRWNFDSGKSWTQRSQRARS